jgi:hypothetical protein
MIIHAVSALPCAIMSKSSNVPAVAGPTIIDRKARRPTSRVRPAIKSG